MEKILSIVIPVYNVEKYIDRCIQSIINNLNFEDVEVVLIDDGSKDNSAKICMKYQKKYKNIVLFKKENGGASDARNFGIEKATGKYIWFVDSDDKIDNCINNFLIYIKENNPDVMICQSKIVNMNEKVFDECKYSIKKGKYSSTEFMKQMKKNPKSIIFCPQYYIIRKEFITENNIYFRKGIICEDELWIPQLLLKTDNIFYNNLNIYYHYMLESSVMHSTKDEKMRNQ